MANTPFTADAFKIAKVSPALGTNSPNCCAVKVPAKLALPLTFSTSNAPAVVPPNSIFSTLFAVSTRSPKIDKAPGEAPGLSVPLLVNVPCAISMLP